MNPSTPTPFRVLIVGGGVGGLEAALALRHLAGERVATTLLAPAAEFVYRPMRVREPFGYSEARHYPLDEICRDIGTDLVKDAFKWLDPDSRTVHTEAGHELEYDALLLAPGATLKPRFRHALTLDDSHLDEQLHGLIQDVEGGYVHKLAFISPTPMPWPLPLYELALMTARRAYDMNVDMSITLATPEDAPLGVFGSKASQAVERLLEDNGILFIPSAHCETPAEGRVSITPGSRTLIVDRVVALPQLFGPSLPGVPLHAHNGFVPIDALLQGHRNRARLRRRRRDGFPGQVRRDRRAAGGRGRGGDRRARRCGDRADAVYPRAPRGAPGRPEAATSERSRHGRTRLEL